MIIFGFRSYVKLLAVLTRVCGHCRNPAAQRMVQVTRKFTLFFVPTFPVGRRRQMTCTFCGVSTRLTKDQADQLLVQAAAPQLAAGPTAPTAPAGPSAPPAG